MTDQHQDYHRLCQSLVTKTPLDLDTFRPSEVLNAISNYPNMMRRVYRNNIAVKVLCGEVINPDLFVEHKIRKELEKLQDLYGPRIYYFVFNQHKVGFIFQDPKMIMDKVGNIIQLHIQRLEPHNKITKNDTVYVDDNKLFTNREKFVEYYDTYVKSCYHQDQVDNSVIDSFLIKPENIFVE